MNLTCNDVDWIAKAEVEPVATKAAKEERDEERRQFVSRRLATSDAPYISPFQISKWTISKWCFSRLPPRIILLTGGAVGGQVTGVLGGGGDGVLGGGGGQGGDVGDD